ncbi:MAG: hypothetical protein WDZ29_01260 [Balneolaceae bacterium]
MNRKSKLEEEVQRFLDGELAPDEERDALHRIAEEPELRELLQFEHHLTRAASFMGSEKTDPVPDHFSDRVMERIAASEIRHSEEANRNRLTTRLLTPIHIPFRPVYGIAAALLLALLVALPMRTGDVSLSGEDTITDSLISEAVPVEEQEVWIRFVYLDESAQSIAVAGDFSDWDPVELSSEHVGGQQVWTGLIPVPRGEQRYMFIRNGEEWVTDPLAEIRRNDGFGNENAILIL